MKRLVLLTLSALALLLVVPVPANAGYFFYWRNSSLIHGSFDYNCAGSTCNSPIYRAGSGSGTNACQHNNWIPLGHYDIPFHNDHYTGSLIQGRVWRLTDYQCSNGVRRTELFVHSEETSSNGQYCPTGGDDPFCWEGVNDYYSNGCIKLARKPIVNGYSDLGRIDSWVHGISPANWLHVYAQL
jgi:hypothetical protein